jgi:hypothetical protein
VLERGAVLRLGMAVGAVLSLGSLGVSTQTAAATSPEVRSLPAAPDHALPSYVDLSGSAGGAHGAHLAFDQTQSVTDTPGDVYFLAGRPVLGPTPDPAPADLISATATDNGSNLTFSAKTVALNDPSSDPNWRHNTFIGWGIDPNFSGTPKYFAYFQLNPDGTYNGELAYTATDTPVSCTVSLSFNTTAGYQAVVPSACLPGVTSFQWLAYSVYDTVPRGQDPTGSLGYGKALPNFRRNGGTSFAPPVGPPPNSTSLPLSGLPPSYWLFARDGGVFTFGAARYFGSKGGAHLNQPVVGGASTPDGLGYWLVARDGGIFSFGDARFYGSTGAMHLNAPIVAMIALPTGTGYWLVASDGGVFSFGGARFHGSTGALHLNQPVVGGASTPDGLGYWLVARDGGNFSFGDARFSGSRGGSHLNKPIVSMAADPNGGYWLVASDGGVFSFGGAPFYGSTGVLALVKPIEGIAVDAEGDGYRMVASDGGIFAFGGARFFGSEGGKPLSQPAVGMASVG